MPSLESQQTSVDRTMDLPLQTRTAQFNGVNAKDRSVTFSFSSEQPVQKMFGTEILSHAPGAMVTKRLENKSVAFLKDHAWDQQIGKVISHSVEDGRAYATAKLSRSALASEVLGDMEDGIRTEISVGYIVHEMKLVRSDDKGNDEYLITSWEPLEVSSVSVPADYSVGLGRGADTKMYSVRVLGGDTTNAVAKESPPAKASEKNPGKKKVLQRASSVVVTCPGCGFEMPWDGDGDDMTCPQCGMEFSVEIEVEAKPDNEPDGDDDDNMGAGKMSVDYDDSRVAPAPVSAASATTTEELRRPSDVPTVTTTFPESGSYTVTYSGASPVITAATSGYVTEVKTMDTTKSVVLPEAQAVQESSVITENRISKNQDMAESTAENTRVDVLKENEDALAKIRDVEHARIREITALGAKFDCAGDANEWIRRGKSIQEFHTHILNNKVFSTAPIRSIDPSLGMRPTEQKRYSLTRAILANSEGKLGGFELECSKELEAQVGRKATGFFVPEFAFNVGQRASPPDLTALTSHEGAELIQTTVEPSLIPFLRKKMVLGRAGCTMMGGLVGNMALPRQISAATATWNTENFDPTRTGQTFDQVALNPQRLSAVTAFSKQLLAQSQIDVQVVVRDDLLKIVAIAQDLAGLSGSGLSNQPLGILSTTADTSFPSAYAKTSPSVTFASGFPTWTNVVSFEGNVESNDIDLDDQSCCYIASPAVKALWKTLAKNDPRATNLFYPEFIWEDVGEVGRVNGYKAFSTNQLAATNQVIFGKFSDLVIGTWGGIDLITDPYTLASSYQVRVIINLLTTIALRYGPAFCYSTNSGLV